MSVTKDNPGVIAPPPLIYLGWLAAGYIIDSFWNWTVNMGPFQRPAAAVLVAIGLLLSGWSVLEFVRHGTHPDPRHPTTNIIQSGPFRVSRNPIYVAFTLIHLGVAFWMGKAWMVLMVLPALALIRYGVIAREERYLEQKFGQDYVHYRNSVRRWM